MKNYEIKSNTSSHPFGVLSSITTKDGSFSLNSHLYKEAFHSSDGARKEAQDKFIKPSELKRFKKSQQISVLDVCFGLGYNTACLIEELNKTYTKLIWWGLEIDPRPLDIALKNNKFTSSWSPSVLKILQSLQSFSTWENDSSLGTLIWGDAREKISLLPHLQTFDLIFLDAFSPRHCPQLWTEEFLNSLTQKLSPGGRLITYSRAAAIRGSLRRSGLQINSIKIEAKNKYHWSLGTVGIAPIPQNEISTNQQSWQPLTKMEEEHLLTRAAIPYRDPSSKSTSLEILTRRKEEQQISKLTSTSSWRMRWERLN